jgi:hypothetical protein
MYQGIWLLLKMILLLKRVISTLLLLPQFQHLITRLISLLLCYTLHLLTLNHLHLLNLLRLLLCCPISLCQMSKLPQYPPLSLETLQDMTTPPWSLRSSTNTLLVPPSPYPETKPLLSSSHSVAAPNPLSSHASHDSISTHTMVTQSKTGHLRPRSYPGFQMHYSSKHHVCNLSSVTIPQEPTCLKVKQKQDGTIDRYKARLVAKGFD